MSINNKKIGWRILCALFVILTVISFTPWVIPIDSYRPKLWGLPYTLWVGFLVATIFVLLTYLGTIFFPGSEEQDLP